MKQNLIHKQNQELAVLETPETMEDIMQLIQQNVPLSVIHNLLGAEGKGESNVTPIAHRRISEPFENLRKRSEDLFESTGKRPTVFLVGLGALVHHKARTDFITGFFQSGGFDVHVSKPIDQVDEAIQAADQYELVVLCGKDESYHEQAAPIVEELKKQNRNRKVFIAGRQQEEQKTNLQQAGIDGFIHIKTNAYTCLNELQEWMKGGGK